MPTDQQLEAFLQALRQHAGSTEKRAAIIRELDVDKSMITHWMNGANIPKPDQLFAIERACKLPGGFLSQHLGYVPVGASSIGSAISSDETLTPRDRKLLESLYLSLTSDVSS